MGLGFRLLGFRFLGVLGFLGFRALGFWGFSAFGYGFGFRIQLEKHEHLGFWFFRGFGFRAFCTTEVRIFGFEDEVSHGLVKVWFKGSTRNCFLNKGSKRVLYNGLKGSLLSVGAFVRALYLSGLEGLEEDVGLGTKTEPYNTLI